MRGCEGRGNKEGGGERKEGGGGRKEGGGERKEGGGGRKDGGRREERGKGKKGGRELRLVPPLTVLPLVSLVP